MFKEPYESKYREAAKADGINPDDNEYGSVNLLARLWFFYGLVVSGVDEKDINV